MGTGNLTDRASGQTILASFWNEIHDALEEDFVGRSSAGVPTASKNLGSAAFPWGTLRADALVIGGSSVDTSQVAAPNFRVISGATRSSSNQPGFLVPAGSGNGLSVTLDGTPTSFVFDVNGATVTISSDIAKGSLTAAPGSNNTCDFDDTDAADGESTRTWGETDAEKTTITVDAMGSEITSLVGSWQAFSHGSEVFYAYVKSSTELTKAYRGFFYDENIAPVNRDVFTNNDTITLLKTGYVFVDSDGATIDVTYNNPVWSFTAPSSPVTADYWFDMGNTLWKRYDGATFQTVNRTFVGMVVNDTTDCLYARCVDFDVRYKADNTIQLQLQSTSIAEATHVNQMCHVAGNELKFELGAPEWNITTDLATSADMYNATEQASTDYYYYIKDTGAVVISDISPYWRPDLQGWYQPHNPWRCIGKAFNDSGSDLQYIEDFVEVTSEIRLHTDNGAGSGNVKVRRWSTVGRHVGNAFRLTQDAADGDSIEVQRPMIASVFCVGGYTAASYIGITINSTSNPHTSGYPVSFCFTTATSPSNDLMGVGRVIFLDKGDVLRVTTSANSATAHSNSTHRFGITEVSRRAWK
jgi:hypothetical protein